MISDRPSIEMKYVAVSSSISPNRSPAPALIHSIFLCVSSSVEDEMLPAPTTPLLLLKLTLTMSASSPARPEHLGRTPADHDRGPRALHRLRDGDVARGLDELALVVDLALALRTPCA